MLASGSRAASSPARRSANAGAATMTRSSGRTTPRRPECVVGVRFRDSGRIYYFRPEQEDLRVGDWVVTTSGRGPRGCSGGASLRIRCGAPCSRVSWAACHAPAQRRRRRRAWRRSSSAAPRRCGGLARRARARRLGHQDDRRRLQLRRRRGHAELLRSRPRASAGTAALARPRPGRRPVPWLPRRAAAGWSARRSAAPGRAGSLRANALLLVLAAGLPRDLDEHGQESGSAAQSVEGLRGLRAPALLPVVRKRSVPADESRHAEARADDRNARGPGSGRLHCSCSKSW